MNQALSPWIEVPFEVQKPQAGLRLDAYLTARLHRYSRAQVQSLISAGRVFLRGRPAKASRKVTAGETVLICYPRRSEPPPEHETLPVIYEDQDFLAVNKPAGVLSHPTDKVVENAATTILKKQFPNLKLHLTHRLDRETSGLLLLAKNSASARALTGQFTARLVHKEYLVIASGRVAWRRKLADSPLGREGLLIKVRQAAGAGQPAATEFHRLCLGRGCSLLRALPRTGRLHQIRVHLAQLGHPVLGDKLYTGTGELYLKAVRRELTAADVRSLGAARQMLHAWQLRLRHPGSGEPLRLAAPPPPDFADCLRENGLTGL